MGIKLNGLQVPETLANAGFRAFAFFENRRDTNLIRVTFFKGFDTDEMVSRGL